MSDDGTGQVGDIIARAHQDIRRPQFGGKDPSLCRVRNLVVLFLLPAKPKRKQRGKQGRENDASGSGIYTHLARDSIAVRSFSAMEAGAGDRRVVVVGGGVAGAMLAKHMQFDADVVLIDS
ncbi:hypothetical protein BHM03_00029306 [Ensete ventricosum]|nr:hypothetical protein BHM03_00029306 [Ensete ventricosum]